MKKLLIVLAVLALLPVGASAEPVLLDADYLIGTVIPGSPSGMQDEIDRLEYFVVWYNTGTAPVPPPDGNQYDLYATGATIPDVLPLPIVWGQKYEGLDLTGLIGGDMVFTLPSTYTYMLAKYGNDSAYFYVGGLTGDVELWVPPAFTSGTGLSHLSFFNPEQTVVPEPASMLLLGSGLIGLATAARRRRRP